MSKPSTRKSRKIESKTGPWLAAASWLLVAAAALVPLATSYVPFAGRNWVLMSGGDSAKSAALGLLVGGALLCWAVALVRGEAQLKRVPYGWLLAALSVVVLASVVTSLDKTIAIFGDQSGEQGVLAISAYVAVFFLATQIVGRRQFSRIVQAIALSGGIVALLGVLQSLGLPLFPYDVPSYLTQRGTSTLGNPDMLGTFLIIPLLLSLSLSVSTAGWRRWLWMVCAAVTGASLLFTQTRGAWLGALVAVGVFGVVFYRSPRRQPSLAREWMPAALLVLVGVAVAVYLAVMRAQSLFSRLTVAAAQADGGRLFVWSEILKVIAKYPILGVGPDNAQYAWYQVAGQASVHVIGIDVVINDAHNYWLGMAVSSGVLAAVLLVAFVVLVLVGSRSAITERPAAYGDPDRMAYAALWAGVVGLCVALVFSIVLTPIGLFLWLSLGLLVAPRARPLEESASVRRTTYIALGVSALVAVSLLSWGGATGLSSTIETVRSGSRRDPLEAARIAARIAPWRQHPLMFEANLLQQNGASPDVIVPVVDHLIRLVPHGYDFYRTKATLVAAQPRLVIVTADQGLAIYPAGLRLQAQRALAEAKLGEYGTAEHDASRVWSIAREAPPAFREPTTGIIYAQILAGAGKFPQAQAVLRELEAAFPGNADVKDLQSLIASDGK